MKNPHHFSTVMIIDDNPVDHLIFQMFSSSNSLAQNILHFTSAQDGLNYLLEKCSTIEKMPEVIFLDINMEGMNGHDFLEEYSKLKSTLKKKCSVIVVSSSVSPDEIRKVMKSSDVCMYLEKPITNEKIQNMIQQLKTMN